MAEQNSISTILPEFLRLFNNSVESFEKVNQAITSSRESVTVNLQNEDGTISRVTIPSFGFLKNSVDRLDKNIQTITNISGGDSSIRLSDGTFRKLVLAKLPVEAQDVTSLNSVTSFDFKSNWFFEGLINPLLYVTFNLTGQVPIDTERTIVSRFILNTNTQSKINYFNNNFLGKSDIDYTSFLEALANNNIQYVLDNDVVDIPPREKRFFGKFNVIRISEVDVTEEVNGVSITTQRKLYKLNKLSYSDTLADFSDTIGLKVGDSLEVVSDPIDTRYVVKQVDSSTNSIVLELVEGSRAVTIGANILQVSSSANDAVSLDVSVGFDERCVTFVKPIDPNSKLPAVNWSPGSGFYTSELTTINENGTEETLATFYQQQAVDFGSFLLSFAQDKIPTSKQGLTPNAPILEADDFKVVLINGQVTNGDAIVSLQELNNQKNTLESVLKELDTSIQQKRTRIQTTNYATEIERNADRNELQGLVTDRSSNSELYSSVVKEIAAKAEDNSVGSVLPKYRARGFWRMPNPRVSPDTGNQDIVKFITRYRYLSADGAANPVQEFQFQDGVGKSQGAFSNWVQLESVVRPREKNKVTGLYEWVAIDDDNATSVNINQLDIPVRKGEQVEVQVKSISEAGWPGNPVESEWSNAARIEFPADLSSDSEVERILRENEQDQARVKLEQTLNEMQIDQHLSSSFTANETYYAHTTNVIASGFLSENQTPIDLFSKLVDMNNQLTEFSEILRRASGRLSVNLVDELGNTTRVKQNTLTKVFAGFYQQEVRDLDDPRGAIVSKTFFINLANAEQTTLQLISRVTGNRGRMVKASENPNFTLAEAEGGTAILPASYPWLNNNAVNQSDGRTLYNSDDADYNTMRKYDLTPILLTNPSVPTDQPYGQDISIAPYQSAQNKGQFLFSRFKDVSSEEVFYNYINPDDEYVINLDTAENIYTRTADTGVETAGEFIWGGGFDTTGAPTTASGYDGSLGSDCLEVHVEHPYVKSLFSFARNYHLATRAPGSDTGDLVTIPLPITAGNAYNASGDGGAEVLFRQSKFAPLQTDQPKGKTQNIYLNENVADLNVIVGTFPFPTTFTNNQTFEASPSLNVPNLIDINATGVSYSRNVKNSFDPNDQYLLGQRSCGSYLFIASEEHENLQVEGDSVQSTKPIEFGNENSLNVPLIFQYRMTDYFGQGSGSTGGGKGNVVGDSTGSTVNVTYAKRLGFDIYTSINDVFQFDIEVFATYKSDKLNVNTFPSATVSKSLTDLEKVVSNLSPSITETKVNQNPANLGRPGKFSNF